MITEEVTAQVSVRSFTLTSPELDENEWFKELHQTVTVVLEVKVYDTVASFTITRDIASPEDASKLYFALRALVGEGEQEVRIDRPKLETV